MWVRRGHKARLPLPHPPVRTGAFYPTIWSSPRGDLSICPPGDPLACPEGGREGLLVDWEAPSLLVGGLFVSFYCSLEGLWVAEVFDIWRVLQAVER